MESTLTLGILQPTSTCSLVCVVTLLLQLTTCSVSAQTSDLTISASIHPSFTSTDPGPTASLGRGDLPLSSEFISNHVTLTPPSSYAQQVTDILDSPDTALSSSATPSLGYVTSVSLTASHTDSTVMSATEIQPTSTSQSPVVASTLVSTPPQTSTPSQTPEGMNSSSSLSSDRTTVASNDSVTKTTLDSAVSTSTLSPVFGNGSCSGNNTGCPEYNGKELLALSTSAIIGIAVGAAVLVIIIVCLLLCLCRKRHTLSGSKADLSTYWDDNVTLSYINGHLDYPKDVSDEMVSLDNDSFLNSLDSMSFSNMWATESAKHTNF